MAAKSPLARVKEEFGSKDKLVDKIVGLLGSGDESKDDLRKRLLGAANGKLLRLAGRATALKELGGHDKLAAAAAGALGRSKDADYVAKLGTYSTGRLLDLKKVAETRAKRAAAKAAGKTAKPAKAKAAKAKSTTKSASKTA
jgi:hypothetical protein